MKVLIIDDSILLQNRLMDSLMKINNEMIVYQALNCRQGMEYFYSYEPDTVILDLELPDGSGISLLRKFKEDKPAVNVIIFTIYSTGAIRKRCMELNALDLVDKSDAKRLLKIMKSMN